MAVMSRANFAKQLEEGLNTVFGLDYRQHPEEWRGCFEVESSSKAYEEDVLVSGFGAAPVKAEGASAEYDEGKEGWSSRYTHETIALQFAITEEAIEDNLYMSMGAKYAKALSRSMQHTKEINGAAIFINAFDADYAGGDGESLLSDAHPLMGGGVYSNKLATPADLAEASIEEMLIQIRKAKDDRGIPLALTAKDIIIPPELEYIAFRILDSNMRPGTADNDVNAINAMGIFGRPGKVVTRLTDPDAWFIRTDCPDSMRHFSRTGIKKRVRTEHSTGNYEYLCRERYVFGWSDPRGCFGSSGSVE